MIHSQFVVSAQVFRLMIRFDTKGHQCGYKTAICMFGLHYRKISDRLSSLISPCQSVKLRDRNNGRLGENIFGHPTCWGRTISDNPIFFRSTTLIFFKLTTCLHLRMALYGIANQRTTSSSSGQNDGWKNR